MSEAYKYLQQYKQKIININIDEKWHKNISNKAHISPFY